MPSDRMPPSRALAALVLALGLAACSAGTVAAPTLTSESLPPSSAEAPTLTAGATGTASGPSGPPTATPTPTHAASGAVDAAGRCAAQTYAELTPAQRAGQVFWVGYHPARGTHQLDSLTARQHIGGAVIFGDHDSSAEVAAISARVRALSTTTATGGVPPVISVDQEGGLVARLKTPGFDRIPPATTQSTWTTARLRQAWVAWARQMSAVGIQVDYAPVADTVPATIGRANAPIGSLNRQYGSDPDEVARRVVAVLDGQREGGLAGVPKHFPGLGRVRGNTDHTASGITDTATTVDDPTLRPFQAAIDAGARLIMVGSGRYPRLDAARQAMFSRPIVTGLLRERMGFDGVVVTDDIIAAAVEGVPLRQRATSVIDAGGDVVLSSKPGPVPTMVQAVVTRAASDPAFAKRLGASVQRVLRLKAQLGVLRCG